MGAWRTWKGSGRGMPGSAADAVNSVLEGRVTAMLALGCDPVSALPAGMGRRMVERLESFIVSDLFPGASTGLADVVFPRAAWLERRGTCTDFTLNEKALEPVMEPAGDSLPDVDILGGIKRFSKAGGSGGDEKGGTTSVSPGQAASRLRREVESFVGEKSGEGAGKAPAGEVTVIGLPEVVHFADGAITRHLTWAGRECPEPYLLLNPDSAAELGFAKGAGVRLTTPAGSCQLVVKVGGKAPRGIGLVPVAFPDVRALFPAAVHPDDGVYLPGPVAGKLEPVT